jgi:hypothetical protein
VGLGPLRTGPQIVGVEFVDPTLGKAEQARDLPGTHFLGAKEREQVTNEGGSVTMAQLFFMRTLSGARPPNPRSLSL